MCYYNEYESCVLKPTANGLCETHKTGITQMKDVPFTQYLRPDGRKTAVSIDRPDEIADKAFEIIAKGFRFECEQLTTGHVSFTVADDDGDVGIELCMNGVDVPGAVDRLIVRVHKELCETHKADDASNKDEK